MNPGGVSFIGQGSSWRIISVDNFEIYQLNQRSGYIGPFECTVDDCSFQLPFRKELRLKSFFSFRDPNEPSPKARKTANGHPVQLPQFQIQKSWKKRQQNQSPQRGQSCCDYWSQGLGLAELATSCRQLGVSISDACEQTSLPYVTWRCCEGTNKWKIPEFWRKSGEPLGLNGVLFWFLTHVGMLIGWWGDVFLGVSLPFLHHTPVYITKSSFLHGSSHFRNSSNLWPVSMGKGSQLRLTMKERKCGCNAKSRAMLTAQPPLWRISCARTVAEIVLGPQRWHLSWNFWAGKKVETSRYPSKRNFNSKWFVTGAACYKLQDDELIVKWFHEVWKKLSQLIYSLVKSEATGTMHTWWAQHSNPGMPPGGLPALIKARSAGTGLTESTPWRWHPAQAWGCETYKFLREAGIRNYIPGSQAHLRSNISERATQWVSARRRWRCSLRRSPTKGHTQSLERMNYCAAGTLSANPVCVRMNWVVHQFIVGFSIPVAFQW